MKKRFLCLALALLFCLGLLPGMALTARAEETPAADGAATLYADYGSGFEFLAALDFDKSVTEQTVRVDRPIAALRVVKGACYELDLDLLTLNGACPAGYERKLSAADNDLIEVGNSLDFALSGSGELVVAARAPAEVMGETRSFRFPQINRGPIVPRSFFYEYVPGSNPGSFADGAEPIVPEEACLFVSEMCYPDSGHPNAPMDIYVADDGETLYVFFEAFIDNTFDHGKDFAGVHVKCGDAVRTYKVHTTDANEYGRWWFGYTDSSDTCDWEHMCYLVRVPLAELEPSGGALELAFEYYGTAGYQGDELLTVAIDGVLLVADTLPSGYWNNPHEYYPDAPLLPAPGVTLNSDGGVTEEGEWWLTNSGTAEEPDYTLTLNGATLDTGSRALSYSGYTNTFAPLYIQGNLTVELAEGTTNTVLCTDPDNGYGIEAECQELVIRGAGTLNVGEGASRPISVNNLLTIRDGADVNVTLEAAHEGSSYWSGSWSYSAVDVFGLTVDDAALTAAAEVSVPSGSEDSVYVSGIEIGSTMHRLALLNNATVEACAAGGNESGGCFGISWYGDEVRLDLDADGETTILEGDDADSAAETSELTTEAAGYSARTKPYAKLETAVLYDLWIAGVQVTGKNAEDLCAAVNAGGGEAGGTICFDPETNTLTLADATIGGKGYPDWRYNNAVITVPSRSPGIDELTVAFSGDNRIVCEFDGTSGLPYYNGICGVYTDFVFEGDEDATLTISGRMEMSPTPENGALCCRSVTLNGGTVVCEAPEEECANPYDTNPYAISMNGSEGALLTVNDGKLISRAFRPLVPNFEAWGVAENTVLSASTSYDGAGLQPYDFSAQKTYRYVLAEPNTAEPTYTVTVENGTGGGSYAEGDTVEIAADEAPEGKVFAEWTSGDGVAFADPAAAATSFLMPAKDVTVTAVYQDAEPEPEPEPEPDEPEYLSVTVAESAHGTVVYPAEVSYGELVTIEIVPDEGYEIDAVTVRPAGGGEALTVTETEDGLFTFTQPFDDVLVTVAYRETGKPFENPFDDVPEDAYYYDAVTWAARNGVADGISEDAFGPDLDCTRAQMVTFLWRVAGRPEPASASEKPFTDLDENAYYFKAVLWAYEEGVALGVGEGRFDPDGTVSRGQAVTFLYRALGGTAGSGEPFEDVVPGAFYYDAVTWACGNGVTLGTGSTTFSPNAGCTRAQIAAFLYRAYGEE